MGAPGVWLGTVRRISPGFGSAAAGFTSAAADFGSAAIVSAERDSTLEDAGSCGIRADGAAVSEMGGEGRGSFRFASSSIGGAGMAGPTVRGRSVRTTGGGSKSEGCGRSGVAASTGGATGAGAEGTSCATGGTAGGATGGATGAGAFGSVAVSRACGTGGASADAGSASSSWRNGECLVSTGFPLMGGGSMDAGPAPRRVDSASGSPAASGGVIGEAERRSGGGSGGATGRSVRFVVIGGGKVGGTDFRVSIDEDDCCPGVGAAEGGNVTRPGPAVAPRDSARSDEGALLAGATGIAGGTWRGATGMAGGVCGGCATLGG